MTASAEDGVPQSELGASPLSWRIPPYQPAVLLLMTSGCAAWAIYTHPSATARLILAVIAVLLFAIAMLTLRMYLYVDGDGIAIRYVRQERAWPWNRIAAVYPVDGVRGAQTLRIQLVDGEHVDVPPSLLLSSRPVSKRTQEGLLRGVAGQVMARRTMPPEAS